ncbi:pyruvate kinase [Flavivirga amylovorans]|uniref:Pyruvate kinase n=1 Tax=Flavivirga amylovorans TaxID=870486 RepID=A0ABT8X771_9FLAO|nr:pyruvate kinase [Flavivirga amylovorans]MDO5989759.1 pyruvate kinase [Flavivirga amylovorans]
MKVTVLEKRLRDIYDHIVREEEVAEKLASNAHKDYRLSSKNLYRYLLLRSYDLRDFHDSLSELGISSLRTSEAYVLSNLTNVLKLLNLLQGKAYINTDNPEIIGYKRSKELIRKHARNLFKKAEGENSAEIMVTLPNEAADDIELLSRLIKEGMKIARINLSHGTEEVWSKMIQNLNEAKKKLGSNVKVYMDLSGPKIRTSKIEIKTSDGKIKESIGLKVGDHLILTKRDTLGKKSIYGKANQLIQKAEVGVLLPEIINDLEENDIVYFDDGMIKAVVISKKSEDVEIKITELYKSKLSSSKGINLPLTKLSLPSLTDRDIELLPFVCKNADILGYSFVRTVADVQKLYKELEKNHNTTIGVVFKIENNEAFDNLPLILMEGMKRKNIGIMIARGDLAVEVGFERISEIQNQILWICEAAHIPVIWATQVLDNLAKTGLPTRAEITDAAHSVQAECVMLNKGPFIVDAIRTLKKILLRMEAHTFKKKSSLRALNVAINSIKHYKNIE